MKHWTAVLVCGAVLVGSAMGNREARATAFVGRTFRSDAAHAGSNAAEAGSKDPAYMNQPPAAPSREIGATGIIRGRVTSAQTGKPLRRARVSLMPASESAGRISVAASTNSQGQFELKEVPAGSYFVLAARAGHLSIQYGQKRPRERGLAVDVRSGQSVERIDIALPRGAVLAGRITDELGEPFPGVRVTALDFRYNNARRIPFPAGTGVTDDLGQYRIPGLPPGSYYVSVSSTETWQNEKKETFGYAAAYFPGGTADRAQTIDLAVAQERSDLDLTLPVSRTARIRGRVQLATGEPAVGAGVSLAQTYRGADFIVAGGSMNVRTERDGTFEIRNVAPGEYNLRAGGGGSASMFLAVTGDIDNLLLIPRTGSTVSGSVVTDEGTAPPFPASGVRLSLVRGENTLPTVGLPAVNNDWSFRMTNLGGPFVFRVRGLPDDWMLDAVRLNDDDITDAPYDVPTGGRDITGLRIVLTRKVGTISGSVTDNDRKPTADATVVVFSDDAARWTPASRFVRATRPNRDGQFAITGLPAGRYFAVAKDFVIEGHWEDKEFLESVRKDAISVFLSEGGAETVTLKLPALR